MNKQNITEEQIKEIVGEIYRDGIAENMSRQDIRINELLALLQKEREAGKREGIEDLKKLIEKSRGNDYHNIGIGELDYHEKCAVDAYIETLKSRMSKLKSQSVEKGNDFKFDNKGNSIP